MKSRKKREDSGRGRSQCVERSPALRWTPWAADFGERNVAEMAERGAEASDFEVAVGGLAGLDAVQKVLLIE